jgi:hypothetical protein
MKTNETQAAPIVQQESMASYCKRKRVNHLSLCDYFVKENMADTESVARLLHMYCVNSRQRIRWGVIYNASMDCKNNGILNDRELEKSFKGKISGEPKVGF